MIPYDELPQDKDHRTHMSFIRTEAAARMGAITTGATTGLSFVDGLSPYLKFLALVISVLVGAATLTYYCLAIKEKWRNLNRDEE